MKNQVHYRPIFTREHKVLARSINYFVNVLLLVGVFRLVKNVSILLNIVGSRVKLERMFRLVNILSIKIC